MHILIFYKVMNNEYDTKLLSTISFETNGNEKDCKLNGFILFCRINYNYYIIL